MRGELVVHNRYTLNREMFGVTNEKNETCKILKCVYALQCRNIEQQSIFNAEF